MSEVYFYGIDEALGDRLISQRAAWEAVREAGGKIFVSGYRGTNFETMGDIQDLIILSGPPSGKEAMDWHSAGRKIWCYDNPQGGIEDPELYRRNYGLLLWQMDYDGASTFPYHGSYGNTWNDFDGVLRDQNFVYPTVDGVIDTIAWEGYREGIDDVRYLTTLLSLIEEAKKSASASLRKSATTAEMYLNGLKIKDLSSCSLDDIRAEMVMHILHLKR